MKRNDWKWKSLTSMLWADEFSWDFQGEWSTFEVWEWDHEIGFEQCSVRKEHLEEEWVSSWTRYEQSWKWDFECLG